MGFNPVSQYWDLSSILPCHNRLIAFRSGFQEQRVILTFPAVWSLILGVLAAKFPPPPAPPAACQASQQECPLAFSFPGPFSPSPYSKSPASITLHAQAPATCLPFSAPNWPCPLSPTCVCPGGGFTNALCPLGVAPSRLHGKPGNFFISQARPLEVNGRQQRCYHHL